MSNVTEAYSEPSSAACAALVYHILGEQDARRRDLMIRDFVDKAANIDPRLRDAWYREIMTSFAGVGSAREMIRRPSFTSPEEVDVVIATVVDVERRALLRVFGVDDDDPNAYVEHEGRRYYKLFIGDKRNVVRQVVLTTFGQALNIRAVRAYADIQRQFNAQAYLLVGMAAGLRDRVRLGDVVMPETVCYYEPGKATEDAFVRRPQVAAVDEVLYRELGYYSTQSSTSYGERLDELVASSDSRALPPDLPADWRPASYSQNTVLVSGEKVIENGWLERARKEIDPRVIAGDQESYGASVGLLRGSRWAVVRGISDFGETKKEKDWQYVASLAAGLAVREFIELHYDAGDPRQF
jgi:nucleoside phosphorylase